MVIRHVDRVGVTTFPLALDMSDALVDLPTTLTSQRSCPTCGRQAYVDVKRMVAHAGVLTKIKRARRPAGRLYARFAFYRCLGGHVHFIPYTAASVPGGTLGRLLDEHVNHR
jgi:hypothetical protein